MGTDALYGSGPGKFPAQGRASYHQEADEEAEIGGMGVSPAGSSNVGCGFWRDRGIHQKEAEYSRTIYCDTADSEPLWSIYLEAGSLGLSEVVGEGGGWLRGVEGESGGGVGRGGGEARRGSGAGGDDGQELTAGGIKVAYLTQ